MAEPDDIDELITAAFRDAIEAHRRTLATGRPAVRAAADAMIRALSHGRKILAFGNGGSAADADHFVAELVGRFEADRPGLSAIALTASASTVTSVANDFGYQAVFARQVVALGTAGDVAMGISTSGRSANVEAALTAARKHGLVTVALTGRDGGPVGRAADIHVNVPDASTPRAQEVHRTILHALCALIDRDLARPAST